jgi:plasmid stabilization system protein ParE
MARSYRIIYQIERKRILVVAVIHGSRLLQPFISRLKGEEI